MKAIAERPTTKRDARTTVRAAQSVPGHAIAPATRARLEARFGHDLGDIRVHTDDLAAAAARELDAHAFAVGRDVFFARGAYRPGTPDGDALLEHEVAHALAAPHASMSVAAATESATTTSTPGDVVERNADAATAALRAGRTPVVGAVKESDVRFARAAAGLAVRPADAHDPAQVVESLVQSVMRALRADANDSSGAVRGQLTRFDERTRRLVLDALHARLVSADWQHLLDVLVQPVPEGIEQGTQAGDGTETAPTAAARGTAASGDAQREGVTPAAAHAGEEPAATATGAETVPGAETTAAGAETAAAAGEAEGAVDHPALQGAEAPGAEDVQGAAPGAPGAGGTEAPGAVGDTTVADAPIESTNADAVTVRSAGGGRAEAVGPGAAGVEAGGPEAGAAEPVAARADAGPAGARSPSDPMQADAAPAGTADVVSAAGTADAATTPELGVSPTAETTAAEPAGHPEAALRAPEESRAPSLPPPPDVPENASPSAFAPPAAAGSAGEPVAGDAARSSEPTAEPQPITAPETPGRSSPPEAAVETNPATPVTAEPAAGTAGTAVATAGPGAATEPAVNEASLGTPVVDLGPEPSAGDDDAIGRLGGGGGGGALPDPPPREAAVPAGAAPAAALAAVASGTPAAIARSLGTVRDAVNRDGARERGALASAPPALERPTGAPRGLAVQDPSAPAAMPSAARRPATPAANAAPVAAPVVPAIVAPLPAVPAPAVTANAEGQVTAADAQRLAQSVDELPTTDPALVQATAGDAPTVALDGDADPALADAHRTALATTTADTAEAGAADAAAALGESGIAPTVPDETLHAELPEAGAAAGGASGGAAPEVEGTDPTAIIAEAQSGDEVRAAAQDGAQGMTAQSETMAQQAADARTQTAQDADTAITDGAEEQNAERTRTLTEVRRHRGEWTAAQRTAVDDAQTEGDTEVATARRVTAEAHERGDTEARTHVGEGNRRIADARTSAEGRARSERDRAKNESSRGGFFSRLASAVTSFFSDLRDAIHAAFDAARKLVTDAIQWAQKAAAEAISRARNAIVAGLKFAADRLTQITDVLLAAFPAARDRFRKLIRDAVTAAIAAVDRFANALKAGVQRLLNALGRKLIELLNAAEKAANDLIASVEKAVQGAIKAAQSFIASAAAFAALIRDIARAPGQWISNLGSAIVDGLRNHLWAALKVAVKQWFNSKVEQVVGIGRMIFDVLRRGGIQFGKIAAMVWAAVKAAIPRAIVEFLVSRLVAMLVPALGAIMAIIDGLKAAWATVQRIIAAFERFIAFLRAVKDGNAGPLFAQALAAAAVAVIDFVANFIIAKISSGAKGVGGKLKGIADKIMAWFRRGAAAVKRGFQKIKQAVIKAAKWVGRQARRLGRWIKNSRLGKAIGRGLQRLASTRLGKYVIKQYQAVRKKIADVFKPATEEQKAARRDAAVNAIRPKLASMLSRGVASLRLRLTLGAWQLWYRVRQIALVGKTIVVANSPPAAVMDVVTADSALIMRLVASIGQDVLEDPRVVAAEERIAGQRRKRLAGDPTGQGSRANPLPLGHGPELLGGARDVSLIHAEHERNPLFGLPKGDPMRSSERFGTPRRPVGTMEYYAGSGPGARAFAEEQHGGTAGLVFVKPLGTYGSESEKSLLPVWDSVRRSQRRADGTPMSDAALATQLRRQIRTGTLDDAFIGPLTRAGNPLPGKKSTGIDRRRDANFVRALSRLMVGVEGGREASAVVDTAVMTGLMERDRLSAARVFARGDHPEAVNPSALEGAFGAQSGAYQRGLMPPNRDLDWKTIKSVESATQSNELERTAIRRRMLLIGELVHEQMVIAKENFNDENAVREYIKNNLRRLLLAELQATYGMTPLTQSAALLLDHRGRPLVAR
jgi:hypothetical protein